MLVRLITSDNPTPDGNERSYALRGETVNSEIDGIKHTLIRQVLNFDGEHSVKRCIQYHHTGANPTHGQSLFVSERDCLKNSDQKIFYEILCTI